MSDQVDSPSVATLGLKQDQATSRRIAERIGDGNQRKFAYRRPIDFENRIAFTDAGGESQSIGICFGDNQSQVPAIDQLQPGFVCDTRCSAPVTGRKV